MTLPEDSGIPMHNTVYVPPTWPEDSYHESNLNFTPPPKDGQLKRQLKNRHIAMISIGGVIGTGLFLGTAESLQLGGPGGLLIAYIILGTITYSVMICLGEMIAFLPVPGGHIALAERFVNRALSFTMGWNYCRVVCCGYSYALLGFAPKLDPAWIIIGIMITLGINSLGVGVYGETEFYFVSIKIVTVVGLIILGIVLDLGGGPTHDRIGFRFWDNPGPFVGYAGILGTKGHFLGWWAVMSQAAFAFIGTEIVAIAAGEAKNPRKTMPKAIKRVYIRILLFYILGTTVIGLLVPSNDPELSGRGVTGTAAASPYVIAINRAGITGLPHVINAAILTAACSAGSSNLFTSSRALHGLAITGNAPRIFMRTTKRGVPWIALLFNACFSLLAFLNHSKGSSTVFLYLQNLTSVAGLMSWFGISLTYIRFNAGLKAQGYDRQKLPYYNPLTPYAAWYCLISTFVIALFSGFHVFLASKWNTASFITSYLSLPLFFVMYGIAQIFIHQRPPVKAENMDFTSDLDIIDAASSASGKPKANGRLRKVLSRVL